MAELAEGELKFVDPDVKVATQGLLAKAEFSNPGNRLRSGMRVRTLVGFGSSQQLAVPFDAVIRSAGQSFVYVIGPARELNAKQRQHFSELNDDTPVAIKRAVTLGPLQNSCYPVLSGLRPGDRLIQPAVEFAPGNSREGQGVVARGAHLSPIALTRSNARFRLRPIERHLLAAARRNGIRLSVMVSLAVLAGCHRPSRRVCAAMLS